jgi:hypothetical protein
MAITTAFCTSAKQGFLSGAFTAAGTYKLALYYSAATLDQTTTAYTTTNEVSGTGYIAGGYTLTGITYATTGNTGSIDWGDASWITASFTARGGVIYSTIAGNPAISTHDFGADTTATGGTFTVTVPAAGVGIVRIT